jgi:hypothetical protein
MLIPSSMRYIPKNIHVNIYVAVNLMIGGPDISGTGWIFVSNLILLTKFAIE